MNLECIAVMPVYNEEACIEGVCLEWLEQMRCIGGALLVVDDGSRDDTPSILERLAQTNGDLIVIHQQNGGHGAAILAGYRHALEMSPEWIFQVDSDGEMPASIFAAMWMLRDRAPFLLGRRCGRRTHSLRLALSTMHRWLLTLMFGVRVQDPNIPFRLMRGGELRELLARVPPTVFAPNVFLAILAARSGHLGEGPEVQIAPRGGGVPSIRGWKTLKIGLRCARELWHFRVHSA